MAPHLSLGKPVHLVVAAVAPDLTLLQLLLIMALLALAIQVGPVTPPVVCLSGAQPFSIKILGLALRSSIQISAVASMQEVDIPELLQVLLVAAVVVVVLVVLAVLTAP
jgi:hypothetical protein